MVLFYDFLISYLNNLEVDVSQQRDSRDLMNMVNSIDDPAFVRRAKEILGRLIRIMKCPI